MGKTKGLEEKADDIEIMSIGKLYTGTWDKKYWSSSRGKDRYPYPVGYKSVRTQNGLTYKMEILEGPKGPSFMISSTDDKSCSGETPDIAWENFQKKGCYRVKLWHGKRFSFKIDGVEFFGFRNAFVQRLLRELVANVGGAAETSLLPSSFSSGASETISQLQCEESRGNPDLIPYLEKSIVTGKRSRSGKVVSIKQLNKTQFKPYQHENCKQKASASHSRQRDELDGRGSDPSTFAAANEISGFYYGPVVLGPENLATMLENDECLSIAERGVQLDSLDLPHHLKVESSIFTEERELITSRNNLGFDTDKLSKNLKPNDRPRTADVKEFNNSPPEEKDGVPNAYHGITIDKDADICAPSTLDHVGDSSCLLSSINHEKFPWIVKESIVNDATKSEVFITESPPEDEIATSASNTSLEKCDIDSVGQEIAKSMMTVLLPRALPLLKTFTRKKKKSSKPSKIPSPTSREENNISNTSIDDASIDTRTADVMSVATTDTILVPEKEIANPKRPTIDSHTIDKLHAIHASPVICAPESESTISRSIRDVDLPEIPSTSCCCNDIENNELSIQTRLHLNCKLQGLHKFFSCYIHPMPISMVQLIVKEHDIYICVKCGSMERKESTLFVYKAVKEGERLGCPSLIGHVPLAFQLSKNAFGRDIALESSLLQFTPDAQALVLLNSIKTPYCREGKLHCSCPACTSDCVQENAVKVVQLNNGYVSLVTRLETTQDVCCLLVCEPSFLLAAEEGGKLKLWVMNSRWSEQKENWYLPTFDCMFPFLVELKRIPKSASLVVGHNGFGEFGLWDIDKRNLVSRFSSPGMSILKCVPASIFKWQRKGESKAEEIVDGIMDATQRWFSGAGRNENHIFSTEDKDVAVWLLISTVPDQDSQCYQSSENQASLLGCWRLALLVNNMLIVGSTFDPGDAAVSSAGHGIIGRRDGLVYEWELSTGTKLGNLHSFKGTPVSCITTDSTNSGALAIASGCQLQVYLSP